MVRIAFLICACTLFAGGAAAQHKTGGLKAGMNVANRLTHLQGSKMISDAGLGFHIGGFLDLGLSGMLSIQPEIMYNNIVARTLGVNLSMNYLSVPVMVKFRPSQGFNIHTGPEVGYHVSSTLHTGNSTFNNAGEMMSDFNFSVAVGAELQLKDRLAFSARYIHGLVNTRAEPADIKETLRNVQVSLAYFVFGPR